MSTEENLDDIKKRLSGIGQSINDNSKDFDSEDDSIEGESMEEDVEFDMGLEIDGNTREEGDDTEYSDVSKLSEISDSVIRSTLRELDSGYVDENTGEYIPKGADSEEYDESGSSEGSEEDEEYLDEDDKPIFLRDDPPNRNKGDYIKWALYHGDTEEYLVAEGFNQNTVRLMALELEKQGYRKRPPKYSKDIQRMPQKDVQTTQQNGANKPQKAKKERSMQVFSKGAPPEAIIDSIKFPGIFDGREVFFENGMKFGLSVAILGIRMAQELSNLGVSQVKPLIEMTKSMREGEALAAKNAAGDAAMEAAGLTAQHIGPLMQQVNQRLGDLESSTKKQVSSSGDPMKDMMVRTMEPVFKQVMNSIMPGMGGMAADNMVSGWKKKIMKSGPSDKALPQSGTALVSRNQNLPQKVDEDEEDLNDGYREPGTRYGLDYGDTDEGHDNDDLEDESSFED